MQFTPKDWIFAYFSFLGEDKLILAGLSYSPVSLTPPKNLSAVDTGEQFFGGVVDTGDKFKVFWLFLTGINNTGEKC